MINTSLGCVDPAREEQEGNALALLALIEDWQAEPGDYDERVGPELDRLLAEDPIRFDDDEDMARYDDVRERYAGSEIDSLGEAMSNEEWQGTRAEYIAELDRRTREYVPPPRHKPDPTPESEDDILF